MRRRLSIFLFLLLIQPSWAEVTLQVLGSGGPEMGDRRASTGYLLWVDQKAVALVDCGPGTALHFEQSGARIEQLEVVLLSHLHVDHSADFPAFLKATFFTSRRRPLNLFGPGQGGWFPATDQWLEKMIGENGAYPYLSDFLTSEGRFQVQARVVSERFQTSVGELTVMAVPVAHGSVPALAWRIEVDGLSIVFSGDMSSGPLAELAQDCDLLVCHNAVPEKARGLARRLHMPPSVIGEYARDARCRRLFLSHRMLRTLGQEQSTLERIRNLYGGPVQFAEDLEKIRLVPSGFEP